MKEGLDNYTVVECVCGGGVNTNFIGGRYLESNGTEIILMDIKLDLKFSSAKMAKSLMQIWDAFTDNSCHGPKKRKHSFFKWQSTNSGIIPRTLQSALDITVFKEFKEN